MKVLPFVGGLPQKIIRLLLQISQLVRFGLELVSEVVGHFSKGGVFIQKFGVVPEGSIKFGFEVIDGIGCLGQTGSTSYLRSLEG